MANARTWLPRGLALLAFALFAWLAPSGMYWLDSSELSAASVSLGAPHPTGFPLYCLVGKAMSLLPIGEIAFRYHLLSAASAALAVLAVCRLVDGAGDHDAASLAGGLVAGALCAVTLGFARQATAAEVYAPNALVLAVALVFFARVARGGGARDGLALAWIAGLGLGMHTTFRALLAVPIIALLAVRLYRGARWPLYAPLIALTVGVALHLYFPVRSATGRTAETDWGHPRTAAALVDYVSAKSIRVSLAGEIMSHEPMVIAADARRFGGEMGDQLGALALVAALGGAVVLFRERRGRWLGAALMVVAVGDAAFSIWVHPIGIEDLQNGLPLTVAVATLAGLGVAALGRSLGRAAPFATGAVGAMLLVGPALVSLPSVAAARLGDLPRQAAEDALAAAPPRALLLVRSDSLAAGLMYLTVVEGARPDVAWLVRQLLPDWPHTDAALARAGVSQTIDRERPLASLLSLGRPVGWELEDDAPPRGLTVSADVPVAGLVTGAPPAGDIARAAARLEAFYAGDGGDDRTALRLAAHQLTTLGRLAVARGDLDLAVSLFDRALARHGDHGEALIDRGAARSRMGDLAGAAADTERALALSPNRVIALVNAARYHLALGDMSRARARAERAARLAPGSADAHALAGIAAANQGDFAAARQQLGRALAIDPHNRDAATAMAQLDRQSPAP